MEEVNKAPKDKAAEALEKESALKAKPEAEAIKVEVEVEFSYITKDREPLFKVLYPGGGWRGTPPLSGWSHNSP